MNELAQKIAGEIGIHGAISFARYMELALYCPVYGYYEKEEDTTGRSGDFYTSVSVGSVFGELLAFQFAEWLEDVQACPDPPTKGRAAGDNFGEPRRPFQLVEAGAHRGDLARDILTWLQRYRPDLFESVEYCIIEPSERRRQWQQLTLKAFHDQVRWFDNPGRLEVRGIIFSNELLDAMPVHRCVWDAKNRTWSEWGVGILDGNFVWQRLGNLGAEHPLRQAIGQRLQPLPPDTTEFMPDGFVLEVSPEAALWWSKAASALQSGILVTFDYGLTTADLLQRTAGTLQAYRQHHPAADLLSHPGEHDLTAHVDFSQLIGIGENAGLKTVSFLSQEQFLTRVAAPTFSGPAGFGEWTPPRIRQFQTLTHPSHLGRTFQVLVQGR